MNQVACPFCSPPADRVFYADERIVGLWDGFPVSDGHALLIPRPHVAGWFEATEAERAGLTKAVSIAREKICELYSPDGFNIGVNIGAAAGQTIFHLHLHVIPRYKDDVPDPRGGVRHVLSSKANYFTTGEPESTVEDAVTPFTRQRFAGGDGKEKIRESGGDVAAFGERMLQLLDETRRVATYKYAVVLGLIDLCLERAPAGAGREMELGTRELAEKVLELYWPHTAPFHGSANWQGVLKQNTLGQAEILSAIRKFRERFAADPSQPLSQARRRAPEKYDRLIRTVEWKLIEMPLPRVQVIGNSESRFLYQIGWTTAVKRGDVDSPGFDNRIYLRPGVDEHLVRLSGLLRPLVQHGWAAMVAGMNPDATDEARLHEFLFGEQRISLDPVRKYLRELQNNRCFYCDDRIDGPADVDHFVPWTRYPDNGIENLVVAHPRCNGAKSDFLGASEHVQRWRLRFPDATDALSFQLSEIARRVGWDRHPDRTANVARSIYLKLPGDVRLWLRRKEFVRLDTERTELERAFAR